MEDFLNYIGYDPGRRICARHHGEVEFAFGRRRNVARPGPVGVRQESGGTTSGVFSGKGNPRRESGGVRTPANQ